MGGNNIDTPKRKVSIKNHLSELLLVFPHTEASRGKSEIIRRASKLAFITWLQTQTTTTTNNRLFISKALIWCIMYLIWLLLPRIGSILNNSWLTLGKKKKKKHYLGQQQRGVALIFKMSAFYLASAAIYSSHHHTAQRAGTAVRGTR